VLVALTILVSALFVTPHQSDTKVWLIVVAAGYLPFAVIVLLATRRRRNKWAMIVGPLGDLVMLAVAQALLHQGVGLTACYPIIAAYVAYTVPGIPTWALAGFTLALSLSVQSQLPPSQRFTISRFGLFAALVIGVLLIVERATARSRGAEERFARAKSRADAVLAAVGSAVVVTDSGSQVLTANPAADQLLDGGHSLTGQLCSAALGLHLGERRLDCSSGCQLLAATKVHRGTPDGDPQSFEAWRPGPDGSRQPVLVSVNALPTTEGPDVEVVHSIQDISRLKQADEAKTLFLATASHELKTPLTVINGYAKTLTTRSLPPDKQREALAAIRRRGVELERVVDRLLLSSRIEAGRAEVANAVVDLIPLVYERAAELATATDRQIDVALPDDLPAVTGDSSAIVTVLDHLLDNAVKYSPDGQTVTVEARTEPADQHPAHSVLLEVTDAGVGMDTQTVERCFDKFWQADASGTRRFGGTGIGLYIVRSLVEAMGGTISVRSQPGSGSTFSVRLLAAEAIPSLRQPIRDEGTASPTRRLPRVTRQPRTAEPESERVSRD
jgi:signal transduction histidine kinase